MKNSLIRADLIVRHVPNDLGGFGDRALDRFEDLQCVFGDDVARLVDLPLSAVFVRAVGEPACVAEQRGRQDDRRDQDRPQQLERIALGAQHLREWLEVAAIELQLSIFSSRGKQFASGWRERGISGQGSNYRSWNRYSKQIWFTALRHEPRIDKRYKRMEMRSFFLSLTLLAGAHCASFAADAVNGETLAKRWCAGCHLVSEDQRKGTDLVPSFASIAARPDFDEDRLAVFLLEPHPKMESMALSRIETRNIAAYIAELKRR
ncbi:c-type cytochrome [Rhodopseudomonas telluris]|uniref:C-type cytochrome n=1 Tax=Rhodopseudomonas telluris TaxID=644215 RepID=A0ABV6EW09_9BRAD